jgi:hypothetical protein
LSAGSVAVVGHPDPELALDDAAVAGYGVGKAPVHHVVAVKTDGGLGVAAVGKGILATLGAVEVPALEGAGRIDELQLAPDHTGSHRGEVGHGRTRRRGRAIGGGGAYNGSGAQVGGADRAGGNVRCVGRGERGFDLVRKVGRAHVGVPDYKHAGDDFLGQVEAYLLRLGFEPRFHGVVLGRDGVDAVEEGGLRRPVEEVDRRNSVSVFGQAVCNLVGVGVDLDSSNELARRGGGVAVGRTHPQVAQDASAFAMDRVAPAPLDGRIGELLCHIGEAQGLLVGASGKGAFTAGLARQRVAVVLAAGLKVSLMMVGCRRRNELGQRGSVIDARGGGRGGQREYSQGKGSLQ